MNDVTGKSVVNDRQAASEAGASAAKDVLTALEALTDAELNGVVERCGVIMAAREKERRDQALAEIQKIAKEAGLVIDLKNPPPKRRRAPRAKPKKA